MAFDPNELNTKNTPARWRIQGKRLADGGAEGAAELAKLDSVYQVVLNKAATFTSATEMGVGNQPGVGSEVDPIMVTGITITGAIALEIGGVDECNLGATVLPVDADDPSVRYSSDDEDVLTVSPVYGLVTAVGNGTATVTATANDGSGITGTDTITVTTV